MAWHGMATANCCESPPVPSRSPPNPNLLSFLASTSSKNCKTTQAPKYLLELKKGWLLGWRGKGTHVEARAAPHSLPYPILSCPVPAHGPVPLSSRFVKVFLSMTQQGGVPCMYLSMFTGRDREEGQRKRERGRESARDLQFLITSKRVKHI